MYFTRPFWLLVLERALKTAAQSAVLAWTGTTIAVYEWDTWSVVGAAAIAGFVLSVLTSVASAPVGEVKSPSLITPHIVRGDGPADVVKDG